MNALAMISAPARRLVDSIRAQVAYEPDPARLVAGVQRSLEVAVGAEGILSPVHRRPNLDRVAHNVLHAEPDGSFSIVSIVWLPGQATVIHDHLCWCAVAVLEGEEHESRYQAVRHRDGIRLAVTDEMANRVGSITALVPPGDIHRVANPTNETTISLHVYGADMTRLGTSIRRCYPD